MYSFYPLIRDAQIANLEEQQLRAKILAIVKPSKEETLPYLRQPLIGICPTFASQPKKEITALDPDISLIIQVLSEVGAAPLILPLPPPMGGLDILRIQQDSEAFQQLFEHLWSALRPLDALVVLGSGELDCANEDCTLARCMMKWNEHWIIWAILLCWLTFKPLLAIGTGLQLVNIARGGSAFSLSLFREHNPNTSFLSHSKGRKETCTHPVQINPHSWLSEAIRGNAGIPRPTRYLLDQVVSCHSNIIGSFSHLEGVARGLKVVAEAPDGIIEAIAEEQETEQIFQAVQFLPQRSRNQEWAMNLFSRFASSAQPYRSVSREALDTLLAEMAVWLQQRWEVVPLLEEKESI